MGVCFHISQTHDNGYIATGYAGSSTLLIKLDSAGEVQWKKTNDGFTDNSKNCGYAVKQTSNGDYIIAGYAYKENRDILLFCTDSLGTLKWQKQYGEEGDDEATSFLLMPDGGCLITGKKSEDTDSISDIWILRTSAIGDTLWTRKYSGGCNTNIEKISAILIEQL